MGRIIVTGGRKLKGEIQIEGSRNAVLPILAATVLNDGISVVKNCPRLKDVEITVEILKRLGCKVKMEGHAAIVDSSTLNKTEIPEDLVSEMRSSIIFLGPMLARCGKVTISYPGGCASLLRHIRLQNFQESRKHNLINSIKFSRRIFANLILKTQFSKSIIMV